MDTKTATETPNLPGKGSLATLTSEKVKETEPGNGVDNASEVEKEEESKEEEDEEEPKIMKPEVKHLINRRDKETGENITTESIVSKDVVGGRWAYSAICVTNLFNFHDEPTRRILEINAPLLKSVLRTVIGDRYPGVSFKTERIIMNYPLRSLFHNLQGIEKECARLEEICSDEEREFLHLFTNFLKEELREDIANVNSLLPEGRVTYGLLWTIFRPGNIFYTNIHGNIQAMNTSKAYEICGQEPQFGLECAYVNYNGYTFGKTQTFCSIQPFEGSAKIADLNCIPSNFHPREKELRAMLIARGRRFEELQGKHYMEYNGIGLGPLENQKRVLYRINGRVMVDCESFERLNTDRATKVISLDGLIHEDSNFHVSSDAYEDGSLGFILPPVQQITDLDIETNEDEKMKRDLVKPMTEEQYLLCNSRVRGFAFTQKRWADFSIDDLNPVQWNDKVFGQLVLPADQKELITALVESHTVGTDNFDDFIKGKGKGFISVLHGPPGVGKTLTAESIAEHTRRPLYAVTSGELGITPEDLESNLIRILDVAAAWKAILLIDEADVFLEKRSVTHDIARNGLVSIFLRLLEYYEGIMFLTTNRITAFDDAFQTRIHLALRYDPLDKIARRMVWSNFLERIPPAKVVLDMEKDVDQLAELEMNGRMIKNVIKTASSLANRKKEGLGMRHLLQVLKIQSEFERDFRGSR